MIWSRWGSPCIGTFPIGAFAEDVACEMCPGSSVYVYEDCAGGIRCCCGTGHGDDFVAQTEAEMYAHLLEHDAKGDHVRRSLLVEARGGTPTPTGLYARLLALWDATRPPR